MEPSTYCIEIRGRLPTRVLDQLTGFNMEVGARTTTLSGPLADAAALYGVIARLEALGLTLLSVHPFPDEPTVGRSCNPTRNVDTDAEAHSSTVCHPSSPCARTSDTEAPRRRKQQEKGTA